MIAKAQLENRKHFNYLRTPTLLEAAFSLLSKGLGSFFYLKKNHSLPNTFRLGYGHSLQCH